MINKLITLILLIAIISCYTQQGVTPEDIKLQTSILIKDGTVVNAHLKEQADVLIENGKITKVGKNIVAPVGARVIDATGKLVMPGGIDTHVHMELPFMGTVSADDFYTGTASALAGGTTLIMDFCVAFPGTRLRDAYEEHLKKSAKAASDYSFHMGICEFTKHTEEDMEYLVKEKGINSFKMFMAYKGALMIDDESIMKIFQICKRIGCVPMVHAENGEAVDIGQKKMIELGITGPEGHPQSRPPIVEAEATHRAITFAELAGVPLYVVHVMSKLAMEEIAKAKSRGVRVIGEPILSGLALDDSDVYNKDWDYAARYVMSPPIRKKEDQIALRNAVKSGVLDLIGTDHCTFTTEQKRMGKGDFRKIPNGVPGLEDRMNIVYSELVSTGFITAQRYVELTSTTAAKVFNIYPRKGAILEGSDADVVIIDPKAQKTISQKTSHHAVDYNAYEGKQLNGYVVTTISRGVVVWENSKLTAVRGAGKFVGTPAGGILFEGLEQENASKQAKGVQRS